MRKLFVAAVAVSVLGGTASAAVASPTTVPGHQDKTDGVVMGKYEARYVYDANGDFVYDLGDGRATSSWSGEYLADDSVEGWSGTTVEDVDAWVAEELTRLDSETLTVCDYVVIYQGDFADDPYLDTGWIRNNVNCSGYDDNGQYNSLYINQSDPRYTGEREQIWGTWEIFSEVVSGKGNLAVNPYRPGIE